MKKLAYGDGTVYVGLTTTEFAGLAELKILSTNVVNKLTDIGI